MLFKMNKFLCSVRCLVLFVMLSWVVGCSQPQPSIEVKGTIMFSGKPVFPGSVIVMDDQDRTYIGNLDDQGMFRVMVDQASPIRLAIKTHKLGNAGRMPASGDPAAEEGSREAGVPKKFQNANVNIPDKFGAVATSGLNFDVSDTGGDLGTIQL